jgi:hypothetical protein
MLQAEAVDHIHQIMVMDQTLMVMEQEGMERITVQIIMQREEIKEW